jgi:hypothetical protein
MKTTLAGPSPIEQFVAKLKALDVIDSSTELFSVFNLIFPKGNRQIDEIVPTQAYLLEDGYRLLLADTRGWFLTPDQKSLRSDQSIDGEMKLTESEMDKSVEYVRQLFEGRRRP